MKKKLWLIQIPVILLFSFFFLVTELGVKGDLKNNFLRETLFPALSRPRNILTDLKFRSRGPRHPKNKIVVVDIDSDALSSLGRWPWHRDLTGFLIEKTFLAGAKVVGLDIVFSEPDRRVPEDLSKLLQSKGMGDIAQKFETDSVLEDVIHRFSDRLVLGWMSEFICQPFYEDPQYCPVKDPQAVALYPKEFEKFSVSNFNTPFGFDPLTTPVVSFVTPIANISNYNNAALHSGYFNAFLDPDGYIRRSSLFVFGNGKPYPSLPFEMARVGLGEDLQITLNKERRVKSVGFVHSGRTIPVTPLGTLEINFKGTGDEFPHIPALDILSDNDKIEDPVSRKLSGLSKKELLKDAYVFIGISAVGVFDMRQFPFESNAPGVDGHANILDNILSGDPIIPSSNGNGMIWMFMVMIFGAAIFAFSIERLDAVPALVFFVVVLVVFWLMDFKVLFSKNYNLNTAFFYLEVGTVFILTLAAKYVMEERNKKFIRSAFTKYVAPAVVDSILKDPTKLSLGGEKREITILFSDIRGFTTFSEKMDAKALAAFLNDYLGIMTKIVFDNQGTLDKYIGDAVMAFWGAPLDVPDHAERACQAAIQMMQALERNQQRFKDQYGIDVKIGIGINSGIVNVGNMGSENNFEYTVIGDHVNLASRLEGLTKKYGASIVTTRFTFDCIAKTNKAFPSHRILDSVKVKGKNKAVELIQVLDSELSLEGIKHFAEGQELYRAQKWQEASAKFKAASQLLVPSSDVMDGPCETYLKRCELFAKNPPGEEWDGSWAMDSK